MSKQILRSEEEFAAILLCCLRGCLAARDKLNERFIPRNFLLLCVSSVPKNGKRSIKMSVEKACDILGKQTANQKHQRLKSSRTIRKEKIVAVAKDIDLGHDELLL